MLDFPHVLWLLYPTKYRGGSNMASKKHVPGSCGVEQESMEEMEMLFSLMQTGECIGGMDLGGTHYQLWDYKTYQQCKLPADIIVGIWVDSGKYAYFYIK